MAAGGRYRITAADLMEIAGLNSDGVVGWESQVALRTFNVAAVWPEHFRGSRVQNFERGSRLARAWMAQRRGVGLARRSIRAEELRRVGGTTPIGSFSRGEHREEQLATLREVVAVERRVTERRSSELP